MHKNSELDLAWGFVEKTDRNIFLTGNAGTGKTTFLHKIKYESLKRLVVVAPTGVAAINAKGVTIHSFFQLPFGSIVPGVEQNNSNSFKHKFSKTKIDIIKSLDLLIIDEISMVRADLLDGIDQVLRRYKNRNKVFGGVQVLMIGDLHQLSPVVNPNEWELLKPHYNTPYFFSSKSFRESHAISIELKHIYRQDNKAFIAILNEIRNNKLSLKSATVLNNRFQPDFIPKKNEGYITLTTHNNRANAINKLELNKLKSKSQFYSAEINGKFNDYAYPTSEKLELKVGAQVMFIKNDSSIEKRYFNGKVGTITYLDNDFITVQCPDDENEIEASSEKWENVSYTINQETKEISEDIIGSFSQIPLRLAWAITIHKSQGLTFEKAIIDAEASFAHGQTYVALSRCKSLEGIVLKTKIKESSIINDNRVAVFTKNVKDNLPNETDLKDSQKIYQLNLLEELFNYFDFIYPLKRILDVYYNNRTSIEGNIIEIIPNIKDNVTRLLKISTTFKNQINELGTSLNNLEEDDKLQERIHKGIAYFTEFTREKINQPFEKISFTTDNKQVKKDLNKQLDKIEDLILNKTHCLNGLSEKFSVIKYLDLRAKAVLEKSESSTKKSKKNSAEITTTNHPKLFEELRELRHIIANSENLSHFQIFTQKSLYEMCEYLPTTPKQLRTINGMGKIRVEKYGEEILEIILKYIGKNNIKSSFDSEDLALNEPLTKPKKQKKGETQKISYDLFKSGMSIKEIAKKRGLVIGTIQGHLTQYILTGDLNVEDLMPKDKYLELKKIMKTVDFDGLSDLKNKIVDKFTYVEMRMVNMELNKES